MSAEQNNHLLPHPQTPTTPGRAFESYSRPRTPGTPGTFDTNFSDSHFQDNAAFAAQYDPHSGTHSPIPRISHDGRNTYYFEKEGGAAAGAGAASAPRRGGFIGWIKRHPIWAGLAAFLIVAAIIAAAVGGAVGGSSSSSNKNDSTNKNANDNKGSSSGNGSPTSSKNGSPSSSSATPSITPLPTWDMTNPETKMVGVSLGNWLSLERWLDEDWFTGLAGEAATDEWTFTQNLGAAKAQTALQQHWNSFIQESDIDTLQSVGINTVRIPLGYWAFVDSAQGEPYLSKIGQTDQLEKLLGWLYKRKMYAMIDLHGMPGSQNGDQSSGHNTSNIQWFSSSNFGYSYSVLNATIAWIKQSPYSSVVHSVCPVNEPRPNGDSGKLSQLTSYYESAYQQLKSNGLIMHFHHGFVNNPFDYWTSFATGKDPHYLAFNTNPYPGWFPPNSDSNNIVQQICQLAQQASQFPVPVVMTEYSVVNNVGSSSFNQEYYNTEVSAFAWSGGSFFWTFAAQHSSDPVQAEPNNIMDMYSFKTLVSNGVIAKVNSNAQPLDTIKGLSNQQCGSIPTVSWSNPSGTNKVSGGGSRR